MIWLAWLGVVPFITVVIIGIVIMLKEGQGMAIVFALIVAPIVIYFGFSMAFLVGHYGGEKEPQKLECVR